MKLDLRYLSRDRDRHGNIRYYVRQNGRRIRLKAEPCDAEFHAAYAAALEALARPKPVSRAAQLLAPAPDSLRRLTLDYLGSQEFAALRPNTQRPRRRILEALSEAHGHKRFALLETRHVRDLRNAAATGGPEAGNAVVKALSALYAWAAENEFVTDNPAHGLKKLSGRKGGYRTWAREDVAAYVERHPPGTKAYLALAILLYTGQRRSDVVRLGRQHVRDGWLIFDQQKTGARVEMPLLPALHEAIEASPSGGLTFLMTHLGQPYSAAGFGNRFHDWCGQAGLSGLSAHGLRKAGAALAAERGATTHELMAIFGWRNIQEAERYTRQAARRKLSERASELLAPERNEAGIVAPSVRVMPGATTKGKK